MITIMRYVNPADITSVEDQQYILGLFRQLDIDEEQCWTKLAPMIDLSYRRSLESLADRWSGEKSCLFVLYAEQIPVGIVECYPSNEENISWLSLGSVCVDAGHRRLGYATQLIHHVLAYAKSVNTDMLSLHVNADNPGAFILYQKLGFTVATRNMTLQV